MMRLARLVAASLLAAISTLTVSIPAHADTYRNDQWYLTYLRIAQAHAITQGAGMTVAVIDTGIEANHPDLTGNVLPGADVVAGGSGNGWGDVDGHGTGMAGIIAGHGHGAGNRDGVLGIAPQAKILPIRINTGAGWGGGDALAFGIDEAVKRGVKIISISMSAHSSEAIEAVARAHSAGAIIIASSGNEPTNHFVTAPARYPGAVAVGAVDRKGSIATVSTRGDEVVLTAPGVDITSTNRINKATGSRYRRGTGTSDSAAIVSGIVALVWAKYPQLTNDQIIERLTATAVDKGAAGRDRDYGFGVIDPVAALTANVPTASPTPTVATAGPVGPSATALPDTDDGSQPAWFGVGLLVVGAAALVGGVILTVRRRRAG
jgi:type VII secretion-associated serine protease mycosin